MMNCIESLEIKQEPEALQNAALVNQTMSISVVNHALSSEEGSKQEPGASQTAALVNQAMSIPVVNHASSSVADSCFNHIEQTSRSSSFFDNQTAVLHRIKQENPPPLPSTDITTLPLIQDSFVSNPNHYLQKEVQSGCIQDGSSRGHINATESLDYPFKKSKTANIPVMQKGSCIDKYVQIQKRHVGSIPAKLNYSRSHEHQKSCSKMSTTVKSTCINSPAIKVINHSDNVHQSGKDGNSNCTVVNKSVHVNKSDKEMNKGVHQSDESNIGVVVNKNVHQSGIGINKSVLQSGEDKNTIGPLSYKQNKFNQEECIVNRQSKYLKNPLPLTSNASTLRLQSPQSLTQISHLDCKRGERLRSFDKQQTYKIVEYPNEQKADTNLGIHRTFTPRNLTSTVALDSNRSENNESHRDGRSSVVSLSNSSASVMPSSDVNRSNRKTVEIYHRQNSFVLNYKIIDYKKLNEVQNKGASQVKRRKPCHVMSSCNTDSFSSENLFLGDDLGVVYALKRNGNDDNTHTLSNDDDNTHTLSNDMVFAKTRTGGVSAINKKVSESPSLQQKEIEQGGGRLKQKDDHEIYEKGLKSFGNISKCNKNSSRESEIVNLCVDDESAKIDERRKFEKEKMLNKCVNEHNMDGSSELSKVIPRLPHGDIDNNQKINKISEMEIVNKIAAFSINKKNKTRKDFKGMTKGSLKRKYEVFKERLEGDFMENGPVTFTSTLCRYFGGKKGSVNSADKPPNLGQQSKTIRKDSNEKNNYQIFHDAKLDPDKMHVCVCLADVMKEINLKSGSSKFYDKKKQTELEKVSSKSTVQHFGSFDKKIYNSEPCYISKGKTDYTCGPNKTLEQNPETVIGFQKENVSPAYMSHDICKQKTDGKGQSTQSNSIHQQISKPSDIASEVFMDKTDDRTYGNLHSIPDLTPDNQNESTFNAPRIYVKQKTNDECTTTLHDSESGQDFSSFFSQPSNTCMPSNRDHDQIMTAQHSEFQKEVVLPPSKSSDIPKQKTEIEDRSEVQKEVILTSNKSADLDMVQSINKHDEEHDQIITTRNDSEVPKEVLVSSNQSSDTVSNHQETKNKDHHQTVTTQNVSKVHKEVLLSADNSNFTSTKNTYDHQKVPTSFTSSDSCALNTSDRDCALNTSDRDCLSFDSQQSSRFDPLQVQDDLSTYMENFISSSQTDNDKFEKSIILTSKVKRLPLGMTHELINPAKNCSCELATSVAPIEQIHLNHKGNICIHGNLGILLIQGKEVLAFLNDGEWFVLLDEILNSVFPHYFEKATEYMKLKVSRHRTLTDCQKLYLQQQGYCGFESVLIPLETLQLMIEYITDHADIETNRSYSFKKGRIKSPQLNICKKVLGRHLICLKCRGSIWRRGSIQIYTDVEVARRTKPVCKFIHLFGKNFTPVNKNVCISTLKDGRNSKDASHEENDTNSSKATNLIRKDVHCSVVNERKQCSFLNETERDCLVIKAKESNNSISAGGKTDRSALNERKQDCLISAGKKTEGSVMSGWVGDCSTSDKKETISLTLNIEENCSPNKDEKKTGCALIKENEIECAFIKKSEMGHAHVNGNKMGCILMNGNETERALVNGNDIGYSSTNGNETICTLRSGNEIRSTLTNGIEIECAIGKRNETVCALTNENEKKECAFTNENETEYALTNENETVCALTNENETVCALTNENETVCALTNENETVCALTNENETVCALTNENETVCALTNENETVCALTNENEIEYALTNENETEYALTDKNETDYALTNENETECALAHENEKGSVLINRNETVSALINRNKIECDPIKGKEADFTILCEWKTNYSLNDEAAKLLNSNKNENVEDHDSFVSKNEANNSVIIIKRPDISNDRKTLTRNNESIKPCGTEKPHQLEMMSDVTDMKHTGKHMMHSGIDQLQIGQTVEPSTNKAENELYLEFKSQNQQIQSLITNTCFEKEKLDCTNSNNQELNDSEHVNSHYLSGKVNKLTDNESISEDGKQLAINSKKRIWEEEFEELQQQIKLKRSRLEKH